MNYSAFRCEKLKLYFVAYKRPIKQSLFVDLGLAESVWWHQSDKIWFCSLEEKKNVAE